MLAGGAVAVAVVVVGCSDTTDGTPTADPRYAGMSTTSKAPSTTRTTVRTTPRTRTPSAPAPSPPAGLAATTCGEWDGLDDPTKRQVIDAIGATNELVALNPELWIGIADGLCVYRDPTTPVSEVVGG